MRDEKKAILYKLIGENIGRYIKEVKGFTQTEFAQRIEMERSTLSNIIAGRQQVSIHLLCDIAFELNVQPSVLIPTFNELNLTSTIDDDSIFQKILGEQGISQKSQSAILDSIEKAKGNTNDK